MFGFLGELILGVAIGAVIFVVFESIIGGGGGGFVKQGSQKDKNIDDRVRTRLRNAPSSSKAELQEWWDTHHPPK